MGKETIIAWTDHTWNMAWGCTKISAGCQNCYADTLSSRYGYDIWGPGKDRRLFGEKHWNEPIGWNEAARKEGRVHRVFSSSMCDNFEDHPQIISQLPRLWELIRKTPNLDWQLLTKRSDRIESSLPADWYEGYKNVWLGVSVEDMRVAKRVDDLRKIPAAVRFMSYEPALGSLNDLDISGLGWVIFGGESGPGYRQMNIEWAREMKSKCESHSIPYFFKQSAAPRTEMGITLDGQIVRNYPLPRAIS